MKIIYSICGLYNSGGMERIITHKANYLADVMGYDVTILTTDQEKRPFFFPLSSNVKHVDLNICYGDGQNDNMDVFRKVIGKKLKTRTHFKKLNTFLMEQKADIVITTFNNDIDMLPKIQDGSKKIAEFHFSRQTKILEAPNRFLAMIQSFRMKYWSRSLSQYDAFVVLTKEDSKNWSELKNLHVIPNFIDNIPPLTIDERGKRVISVGRSVYQKGFDMLIKSWSLLQPEMSDWSLFIYGGGDKTKYQQLINTLCLSETVHLMPATPKISDEYDKSSFYVLSSRYEGLPMVLIEAMSHGLPLVCFECPCGPKDIVKPEFGSLVKNGDIQGLANAIKLWMIDKDKLVRGRESSYSEAKRFEKDKVMQLWINLFNELVQQE